MIRRCQEGSGRSVPEKYFRQLVRRTSISERKQENEGDPKAATIVTDKQGIVGMRFAGGVYFYLYLRNPCTEPFLYGLAADQCGRGFDAALPWVEILPPCRLDVSFWDDGYFGISE